MNITSIPFVKVNMTEANRVFVTCPECNAEITVSNLKKTEYSKHFYATHANKVTIVSGK